MEITVIIRYLNVFISLLSIPPALFILRVLVKDKKIVDVQEQRINKLLTLLFSGVVIGTVANAGLSILSIKGLSHYASYLSIYRSIYTSSFFCFITWSIYFFQKSISKK